jgi:hypothetical protein
MSALSVPVGQIILRYKKVFSERGFVYSFIGAFLILFGSLVVNYYAGTYATEQASNPVTDLILDQIPVFYLQGVFVYGAILFWIFVSTLLVCNPKQIPFTLKCVALFVLIRALFISLTHIGPFPTEAIIPTSNLVAKFTFGGDLFFSGHTGLPFLMALVFQEQKVLRTFFVSSAVFFGVIVLLAHLHYSIDVLAAFFITYTIYHLAKYFFTADYRTFYRNDA